jgi:hypothetical protein
MSYHGQLGPSLTLSQRLERLTNNLEVLRDKLKDAIAGAIGTAVADAVQAALLGVLGSAGGQFRPEENHWQRDDQRSWDNPGWNDAEDGIGGNHIPSGRSPITRIRPPIAQATTASGTLSARR